MTPEEIQQVVEDYRKSSQSLNEFIKVDFDKLRNFGRDKRDKKNGNGAQGAQGTQDKVNGAQGVQSQNNDNVKGPQDKVNGAQGAQGTQDKVNGAQGAQGTQDKVNGAQSENKIKDNGGLNLKDMEKYSSSDSSRFDSNTFKTDPVKVKPKISPATFKTNQNQSRDLVKTGKLKDTDLNKYSRSSSYTADDGKTQVNRSTVNTIAKFDMGPNIKKGDKLGVISGNMRKKYDMKAASFKPEAYDLLLDYVLSEGHADTVEEAHYVMTQMDAETIQTIVEFIGGRPGDGYLGHPNLNIKNPLVKDKDRKKNQVVPGSDAKKLPDVNINKVGATIGDRNMRLKKMIDDI